MEKIWKKSTQKRYIALLEDENGKNVNSDLLALNFIKRKVVGFLIFSF